MRMMKIMIMKKRSIKISLFVIKLNLLSFLRSVENNTEKTEEKTKLINRSSSKLKNPEKGEKIMTKEIAASGTVSFFNY
jgi:hypothetical protein